MSKYQAEEGEEFDVVPASEVVKPQEKRVDMVAPTETLEDGTLKITDFVHNVKLDGFRYDKEKNFAMFFFKDAEGKSSPKFFYSPHHSDKVRALAPTDPEREKIIKRAYMDVVSMFKNFIYSRQVEEVYNALEQKNLRIVSQALWDLYEGGKSRTPSTNSLKLVFQAEEGIEPKYQIARSFNWLGNPDSQWGPKFVTPEENPKYYDKVTFKPLPPDQDFADPSNTQGLAPADDFAANAADANDILGGATETLVTPEVNLLD